MTPIDLYKFIGHKNSSGMCFAEQIRPFAGSQPRCGSVWL